MRKMSGKEQGSALLMVCIMVVVVMATIASLFTLSNTSNVAAYEGNKRLIRLYAAEAGLQRAAQIILNKDEATSYSSVGAEWLSDNAGDGPVQWPDGNTSFAVGDCSVEVEVEGLADGWFIVNSSATDTYGDVTTVARTVRGESFWSDYARFVSAGVLNIGSNAYYGGKVHCNSNINVVGEYVKFEDNVTASGKISPYTNKKYPDQNTVFMKDATAGVPEIKLPDADEINSRIDAAGNPSTVEDSEKYQGALVYNAKSPDYKAKVAAATGYTPADTDKVNVDITFQNDVMQIISTVYDSKGKLKATLNESNVGYPHTDDDVAQAIYVGNDVTVRGNISGRTSVLTPKNIYIDGPVRYVDDDGGAMWELVDKDTGDACAFDETKNSWSTMGNWTGSDYEYKVADDWDTRTANIGREMPPVLGLMSGSTIYITGETTNRELHAALFTSGDVIRPKVNGQKQNLYINGAIITAGTNPVSSFFSYRCYAYDPFLKKYPPPEFNQNDKAAFTNWHIVREK
ncbi:MAG: hypothetical protein JXR97_12025 [Planctomycetes bacterium]|nr:hypothetical protein [Planctomycetota bacterium]